MKSKEKRVLIILVVALILIDQILKIVFLTTGAKLGNIDGFSIGTLENLKSENNLQYILISIIATVILIRYIARNNTFIKMDSRIIISFAVAGVISNFIDRIWDQATINYINIPKFASINLGYIYIAITWIGLAVILTKYTSKRMKEKNIKKWKD